MKPLQFLNKLLGQNDPGKERLVVFFHIPKTGGTTFRSILLQLYGSFYYYVEHPGINEILQAFRDFRCIEFHNTQFEGEYIYSHREIIQEKYWHLLKKKDIFIMFRDPVKRLISNYFELERRCEIEGRPGIHFDQFLRRVGPHNKQVAFLLGNHPSSRKFPTRDDLPYVKRMMTELRMNIGILERYDESLQLFQSITGKSLPAREIKIENATHQALLNQIDPKTREKISQENQLDLEIYDFAQQLFEKQIQRIRSEGATPESFKFTPPVDQSITVSQQPQARPSLEDFPGFQKKQDFHASRYYLICATPRSGSTLLCQALADSGVAGNPEEFFLVSYYSVRKPQMILNEYERSWLLPPQAYLKRIFQTMTPNGVVGMKTMYAHFVFFVEELRKLIGEENLTVPEILNRTFPNLQFVFVKREDSIRQAVSWAKAEQTGIWQVDVNPNQLSSGKTADSEGYSTGPAYNFGLIHRLHKRLVRVNNAWEKFFSDHAIQPYCVTYESLVKNYQQSIVRLLDSLGIDRLAQTQLRSPRLKRQSDTVNEEWARRFREDLMSTEQPNSGQ